MTLARRILALGLISLASLSCMPPAKACGPESLEPIFVFQESPDIPFEEFTRGKIGIVQPGFGRKTLVIAYRYLNGRPFGDEEQKALGDALTGKAPEDNGRDAFKAWVAIRKEFLKENETLPQIYTERRGSSYDFFPNCAKNAFEVATATLKDRASSYGAADQNVRAWIAAQDTVFANCSGGAKLPSDPGGAAREWLRKDRDYQIAAALFYSLNFEEARRNFQMIAADADSPWEETATYLVARSLLRQASLAEDEAKKHELYQKAEIEFQNLVGQSQKFHDSSRKLLGLIKYHLHPEERTRELAVILTSHGGNENLRQDLIDYVWLLDRFEKQIAKAEKERKEALKPPEERQKPEGSILSKEAEERYKSIQRGDFIDIGITLKKPDGTPDYSKYISLDFKFDATQDEILQAFETNLDRKLS